MAKAAKSETVPKAMQEKFDSITAITDEFAKQHLNDEYALLIRQATAALCRKRPSPLMSGREKTWACGITHAIGMVNFLFDSSQEPHVSAKDLYALFGVGASTGQGKSKQVRDMLNMHQMDPNWCLPSLIDQNPLAWMISVDGMILDARSAPRAVQEQLAAAGIIPYVPNAEGGDSTTQRLGNQPQKVERPTIERAPDTLYVLDVSVIDGPITEEFLERNPEVTRTIEIKGSQTLAALHQILFKAFDREDEHMYEFQVGGKGPQDPAALRYGLTSPFKNMDDDIDGAVEQTTINDLNLTEGEFFGYWFDFGDDWWHVVEVKEIGKKKAGKGKFPKITNRIGASPPQYADFE